VLLPPLAEVGVVPVGVFFLFFLTFLLQPLEYGLFFLGFLAGLVDSFEFLAFSLVIDLSHQNFEFTSFFLCVDSFLFCCESLALFFFLDVIRYLTLVEVGFCESLCHLLISLGLEFFGFFGFLDLVLFCFVFVDPFFEFFGLVVVIVWLFFISFWGLHFNKELQRMSDFFSSVF
jgi:hypothetical protein